MIPVQQAIEIILSSVPLLNEKEKVSLFEAHGRFLAEDITATFNVPPNDNSSMDGYAVLYSDIKEANPDSPVILKVIKEIRAGENSDDTKLCSGSAIRIMTGAPTPEGADSVIPFEDTEESGENVIIKQAYARYEFIRSAGEDIKAGEKVLLKGTRLDSPEIGLLASMNIIEIPVIKKPEVAILSTGDEVLEPGSKNPGGKIYNSNSYVIFSEVKKYGGNPHYEGIVRDHKETVLKKIKELMGYDIIISSGGVSMGNYDFIPDVLEKLGVEIKIKTILMKPGKPVVFGVMGKKLFFGLPGNPVSTMVTFNKCVRPALLKMSGAFKLDNPVISAMITEDIHKQKGKRYFLRGIFSIENGKFKVKSTGPQSSGMLTSMSRANCLIDIPEETEHINDGDSVNIELIKHGEI